MKTVIKGLKEVKRLVGIKYEKEMPKLDYRMYLLESDEIIQEFEEELIRDGFSVGDMWTFNLGVFSERDFINVLYKGKLEKLQIVQDKTKDGVKTIIVNKILEYAEQKFNYDEIEELYDQEVDKYWQNFLKKYENDTAKTALINMYDNNGMNMEDIVEIIESDKNNTNTTKIINTLTNKLTYNSGGIYIGGMGIGGGGGSGGGVIS